MKLKSDSIRSVFLDEFERNKRLIDRYFKELDKFPKGSVYMRKIGSQEYYYLNVREGVKVTGRFLGNVKTFDITTLKNQLAGRKRLEKLIKKLKTEQKELEKNNSSPSN